MASETATSKRKHLSPNHSCAPCRQKKVRCSGTAPCDACVKYGVECVYEEGRGRRPGYFGTTKAKRVVRVMDSERGEEEEEEETLEVLEERVKSLESALQALRSVPSSSSASPCASQPSCCHPPVSDTHITLPIVNTYSRSHSPLLPLTAYSPLGPPYLLSYLIYNAFLASPPLKLLFFTASGSISPHMFRHPLLLRAIILHGLMSVPFDSLSPYYGSVRLTPETEEGTCVLSYACSKKMYKKFFETYFYGKEEKDEQKRRMDRRGRRQELIDSITKELKTEFLPRIEERAAMGEEEIVEVLRACLITVFYYQINENWNVVAVLVAFCVRLCQLLGLDRARPPPPTAPEEEREAYIQR
ncbi:hypothetical protein BT69DRAFT_102218 [Atractiella rhizophila]|nr:hypothetical protein BT69DRAFT_102218 [Atractiella rhizophila]